LESRWNKNKTVEDDEEDAVIVSAFIDIYCDIIDVVDSTNICFGLQSMLGYGLIFFHNLFTNFLVFQEFIYRGSWSETTIMSVIYVWYYTGIYTGVIFLAILNKRKVTKSHCDFLKKF
jgi:hypothetical protein